MKLVHVCTSVYEPVILYLLLNKIIEQQNTIVPHKTLFVEELPKITTDHLIQIFQQYPGFK